MIKQSLKKPSQHCSDALSYQKDLLSSIINQPAYLPAAVAQKEAFRDFTKEGIRRLQESVKFHVPYGGNIMIDMVKGTPYKKAVTTFLKNFRLPFSLIALEYDFIVNQESNEDFIENNLPYTATIILVHEELRENQNPILIARIYNRILSSFNGKYSWQNLPYDIVIDFDKCAVSDSFDHFTSIRPINEDFLKEHNSIDFFTDTKNEIGVLLQFLIAMSCRNVTSNLELPPSMVENKKREKKGLEKRYQYRNIVINTKSGPTNVNGIKKAHQGGTVVTHIRRGHIRHYENKNVWIEQTVVNADNGSTPKVKNYRVK